MCKRRCVPVLMAVVWSCVAALGCGPGGVDPGPGSCGDGDLDPAEQCDDGNLADHDGCSSDCRFETYCGNTLVEFGEECDDGNNFDSGTYTGMYIDDVMILD